MKKIKIVLFLVLLLLLTGCTAEVNIDLKENGLTEKITIVDRDGDKDEIYKRYRKNVPAYYQDIVGDEMPDTRMQDISYYNSSSKELDDGYIFAYSKNFELEDYNKSTSFKSTFRSGAVEYSDEEGTIDLYTDANGLMIFDTYPNLSSVKINITTKLKVLDNNADVVKGNTYSWTISRNDAERNIYLQTKNRKYDKIHNIDKKEDKEDKQNTQRKKKKSNSLYVVIILLSIIGFLIIVLIINRLGSKLGR